MIVFLLQIDLNYTYAGTKYCIEGYLRSSEGADCKLIENAEVSIESCASNNYVIDYTHLGGKCIRRCPDSFWDDETGKYELFPNAINTRFVVDVELYNKGKIDDAACVPCRDQLPSIIPGKCVDLGAEGEQYIENCQYYYEANQSAHFACGQCEPEHLKTGSECKLIDQALNNSWNSIDQTTKDNYKSATISGDTIIITACNENYIFDTGKCIFMSEFHCSSTDGQKCLSCMTGYKLDKGKCVKPSCSENQYYDSVAGQCKDCQANCICNVENNPCTDCIAQHYPQGNPRQCLPCAANCMACTDANKCTQCSDNYVLLDGGCTNSVSLIANCQTIEIEKSVAYCTNCIQNYYLFNNSCYFIEGCETYKSNAGVVICECKDKQVFNSTQVGPLQPGKCVPCGEGYKSCSYDESKKVIFASAQSDCADRYTLNTLPQGQQVCAQCSENCGVCSSPLTCTLCDSQYYIDTGGKCARCDSECMECSKGGKQDCKTCPEGRYLDSGICWLTCEKSQYNYTNIEGAHVCGQCSTVSDCISCTQTAGELVCLACTDGFVIRENKCKKLTDAAIDSSAKDIIISNGLFWGIVVFLIVFCLGFILMIVLCVIKKNKEVEKNKKIEKLDFSNAESLDSVDTSIQSDFNGSGMSFGSSGLGSAQEDDVFDNFEVFDSADDYHG